jgi:hypothetical protein
MVDPEHFERVRIVQDRSIDADEPLSKEEDGTKVLKEVFEASEDSLFPLQGALGYEIHQTLFIGPNCLVVEGSADLLYLKILSSIVERDGGIGLHPDWTITPVGGSGKVPTFVALLAPQKGIRVATLLDWQKKDRQLIEGIYKQKLLQKKRVLTYADFTGTSEADVEDMFDREFYISLVNSEYASVLKKPIALNDLNQKLPRIVQALEDHFEKEPLSAGQFGHLRPALYLSQNIAALGPKISKNAKDKFQQAFMRLNALLG